MATRDELEAAFANLPARDWTDPRDLNRMSIEGLFGAGSGARILRSGGSIRLHGVIVANHAARLDTTADVLSQLQRLVTAMGAVKRGIRSSQGPLPGELVTLTQLKIAAAPTEGSLIFDLIPESLPETELLVEGNVAIFDQGQRQFVDECFEEAIGLVLAAHSIGPDADRAEPVESEPIVEALYPRSLEPSDSEDVPPAIVLPEPEADALVASEIETPEAHLFVERIREGGPRLASAVRGFAKAIESAEFDVDLEWREPNQATRRATFTRHDASVVRHLVVSRDLEVELQDLVGNVITLSTTKAWQLKIGQDTILTVDASDLPPASWGELHLGELVKIRARAIQRVLPGGGTSTTFQAVSVVSMEQRSSD